MAVAKNELRINEMPFDGDTQDTPVGPSNDTGGKAPSTASAVQPAIDPNGTNAAKWYGANFSPNNLQASGATGAMDQYANSRAEASATPMGMANKYNVTGVDARRTSNLSRLVDALNNKKWVTTTANLGFGPQGQEKGGGNVVDVSMPEVETAESRQQRRMEDWQSTAAANELNTRSWLRKMAPQLEMQRQQSILQLEKEMDQTQVHSAISAIDNYFRERFAEFGTNERLRAAAQLAQALKALGTDDVTNTIMSQAYCIAPVDYITRDLTDATNLAWNARARGDMATYNALSRDISGLINSLMQTAYAGAMGHIKENVNAFLEK